VPSAKLTGPSGLRTTIVFPGSYVVTVPAEYVVDVSVVATGALVVEDLRPADFDERAMFHLMNLAREDDAFVLMTARVPPSAFEVELRDLRSRLRAVPTVPLLPPDDLLFRSLIVKFCADRQMTVDESVVAFLATRIERSVVAARQTVEMLDSEALRLGRPVTRTLAAELLRQDRPQADPRLSLRPNQD